MKEALKTICTGVGAAFIALWLLGAVNMLDVRLYVGPHDSVLKGKE